MLQGSLNLKPYFGISVKNSELLAANKEDSSQQLIQSHMDSIKESIKNTHILVGDLEEAEFHIIRLCQKEKFSEEMSNDSSTQRPEYEM